MATRQIGLGTVVTADGDAITLMIDVTPPARKRTRIDQSALGDDLATYAAGIEEHSEFSFSQYWHPSDTDHAAIDTLFNDKTEVTFTIVCPFTLEVTDSFAGAVSALEPESLTRDGMITRRVTVQRMGVITRTEESPP